MPHPFGLAPWSSGGLRALRLALLAMLLSGPARPAAALEVLLGRVRENGGYVRVEARLDDLIPPRVAESLGRGMPARLGFHVELWQRRDAWFDRLVSSVDASLKIRYEVWSERFVIERRGAPMLERASLDSVRAALSRWTPLTAGRVGLMDPDRRYYIVVAAVLKPLSVEDIEEGEGWLSGEVEAKRRSGFGVITGLPRSLFDAVRNFAGFGDQRARAVTPDFDLATLFPPSSVPSPK